MYCYYCGSELDSTDTCPSCEADVRMIKKIQSASNYCYNEGLAKAKVRDLSGAVEELKRSLKFDKMNMNARNLLGLIYYEMGESVDAISEWVISKSLIPERNPASEYLNDVQSSSSRMESLNQTIAKFNQALTYCQQGDDDLAIIQLKKVLSLNPRLVKGNQLLALLYMKQGKYDLAKKSLKEAGRIDANNTQTLTYLRECNRQLRASGKRSADKDDKDIVSYESGNDLIIRPSKFGERSTLVSAVNLLIGAAIGIAVVCFLVIPGVKQSAKRDANNAVVKANENVSTREQDIKSLNEQISDLNSQIEQYKTDSANVEQKISSYENLLTAYISYAGKDYEAASTSLESVQENNLSDNAKTIYNQVFNSVKDEVLGKKYTDAMKKYLAKDYDTAINEFTEIIQMDENYNDGKAIYYLAHSYYQKKDGTNAMVWFQKVVDGSINSSAEKKTAKGCIDNMNKNPGEYGIAAGTDTTSGDTADTNNND